ncbi:nucleocapsid protein [Hipposideros bat coronavirus]|nr:nucleocapsid protein [Hipposideros bat coronavirus]
MSQPQPQRVTFADQTTQGNNSQGARPKNKKPRAPLNDNISWFTAITQHGKNPLVFSNGQGVPRNSNANLDQEIGYWRRATRKANVNGKPKEMAPRWYFYYYGTGPAKDLQFNSHQDGIVWVATPNALIQPSPFGTRNPSNDDAIVTTFAPGTQLPKGCYIEGSRGSQSSSAASSRASSRSSSRNSTPGGSRANSTERAAASAGADALTLLLIQKLEKLEDKVNGTGTPNNPRVVTKKTAQEAAKKPRQKRVPTTKFNVNAAFGTRGNDPLKGNFGDEVFIKKGTEDPRWPTIAALAPNTAGFMFMSRLGITENDQGMWLTYNGAIKLDDKSPEYEKQLEILRSNIDAYKNFSPKPQRVKKTKKAEKVVEWGDAEFVDEDATLEQIRVQDQDKPKAKPNRKMDSSA